MDGKNLLWKQLAHRSDSLSVCSRELEIRICFCDSVKPEFEGVCGHWEIEDSVWTDCEEAELPSLALAASFCLSSLISFSSSLSLLSSWARPRSSEKLVEVLSEGELLFRHTT